MVPLFEKVKNGCGQLIKMRSLKIIIEMIVQHKRKLSNNTTAQRTQQLNNLMMMMMMMMMMMAELNRRGV